jgi:hypothetical protein
MLCCRGIFVTTAPGDGELPASRCYCFTPGGSDTVTRWRGSLVGSSPGLGVLGMTKMCSYRYSNQDSVAVSTAAIPIHTKTFVSCYKCNALSVF